ncbi:hypothetical protein GQ457_12G013470 [Hibiscus cannabinus]
MSTGSREQKKGSKILSTFSSFSLMGNGTDNWFLAFIRSDEGFGFQQIESRSRPPLGRRMVRLEQPSPGDRNPNRYRQVWNETPSDEDSASWMELSDRYKVWLGFSSRQYGCWRNRLFTLVWKKNGSDGSAFLRKESVLITGGLLKGILEFRESKVTLRSGGKNTEMALTKGSHRLIWKVADWKMRERMVEIDEQGTLKEEESRANGKYRDGFLSWRCDRWRPEMVGSKPRKYRGKFSGKKMITCEEREKIDSREGAELYEGTWKGCHRQGHILGKGGTFSGYVIQPRQVGRNEINTRGAHKRRLETLNHAKMMTPVISAVYLKIVAPCREAKWVLTNGAQDKCSFVWRSILKAKEELKAGFHWRIGIDSEVALFQQQWGGDKPIILEGNHLDNHNNPVKCKEFMIPGLAKWDERKVQQVFSSNDAQKILSCPIANTREDILRWSHHHSGLFVTKTAHHWLEKQGWVSHVVSPVWKILSKANVLPKVRIFGWRVAQEALPVGKKLQAACVGPGLCQLCGKDIETVLHALRECPSTQEVLQVSGLERLLPQGPFSTGLQWLEEATQVLDTQQFTFMLVLLWNIWNKRNRWVHQNQLIPPKLVADFAQMLIGEALDSHNGLPTLSADSAVTKWLKPELGSIKVNVDGAWLERGNLAAIGVVARDHNGLLIDARARRLEGSYTPEIVEAYAMAEGFRMAIENGWQNVTFEGDSTGIISKMHADCMDRSVASTYLSEAWKTLKDRADFAIRHVGRECNQAAHQLAHWGLSCIDPFVFSWDTPNCIRDIVINDAIYG